MPRASCVKRTGILNVLSEKTGLNRAIVLAGIVVVFALVAFFGVGAGFFCNVVGFLYPAYASFKAIESDDKEDDTQWLTYWVVYSFFCIQESFSDVILSWIPFYYVFKFAFLMWCQWPGVNGANIVYRDFISPFLTKHETKVDKTLSGAASMAKKAAGEATAAATAAAREAINSDKVREAATGVAAAVLSAGAGSGSEAASEGEGKKDA